MTVRGKVRFVLKGGGGLHAPSKGFYYAVKSRGWRKKVRLSEEVNFSPSEPRVDALRTEGSRNTPKDQQALHPLQGSKEKEADLL